MPLWSQNLSTGDLLAARPRASEALVYLRAKFWQNTGGLVQDDAGTPFHLAFRYQVLTSVGSALPSALRQYPASLNRTTLYSEVTLAKALSVRAGLVAALEPTVLSVEVGVLDANTSRLTVTFDKPASISLFVKRLSAGVEAGLLTAGDGSDGGSSKTRTLDFPRQTGSYRVIVRAGMSKFARDYLDDTATTAITTYASASDAVISGGYPQGVADGRRAFAQDIYPLGDAYGFNSSAVLAGPNWDTPATRQSLITTVANKSSIDASKTFLNAMVAAGAPAYSNSSDPGYYLSLAVSSTQAVSQAGGVNAYKAVYNVYPAFGYNTSSNDGAYLDGLKNSFVAQIQSDAQATGYNSAYGEIYGIVAGEITILGLPEGYSTWSIANPKNASNATLMARHIYNAGALRAYQRVYDQGLPDGFDWRTRVVPAPTITAASAKTPYDDLRGTFRDEVQAEGRIAGLMTALEYARNSYQFSYDYTNSANRSDTAYVTYLEGLTSSMFSRSAEAGKVAAYKDFYDTAVSEFRFSYDSNLDAANLALLKTAMFKVVYSYSLVAGLQEVYDLANATYFDELTSYPGIRNPAYTTKPAYLNSLANQMRSLKGDYYVKVYESGAIFTYQRLYGLAEPYGFSYDSSQVNSSYYAELEGSFISSISQAGYSAGQSGGTGNHKVPTVGQLFPRGDK